jgi:hypothetical protein
VDAVSETPCSPIKQIMITSFILIIHKPQLSSADKTTVRIVYQCVRLDSAKLSLVFRIKEISAVSE